MSDLEPTRIAFSSIEELAESLDEVDSPVLGLAQQSLTLQRLLFSGSTWRRINNNRNKLYETLSAVYPYIKWQKIQIHGEPIWKFINRLNESVHTTKTTPGGAKYREQVIARQKGEFCMLCGSRENLHVDHIVAVNMGGEPDDIRNMQLLCKKCNLGKSNITDYDVRVALRVADKECATLRYRVLADRGKNAGPNVIGICKQCGKDASTSELEVKKVSPELSFSYSNLIVNCKGDHA